VKSGVKGHEGAEGRWAGGGFEGVWGLYGSGSHGAGGREAGGRDGGVGRRKPRISPNIFGDERR